MELDRVLDLLKSAYREAAGLKEGDPDPNWDEISLVMRQTDDATFVRKHKDSTTCKWVYGEMPTRIDLDLKALQDFYSKAINGEQSAPPLKDSRDSEEMEKEYTIKLLGQIQQGEVLVPEEFNFLLRTGVISQAMRDALLEKYRSELDKQPRSAGQIFMDYRNPETRRNITQEEFIRMTRELWWMTTNDWRRIAFQDSQESTHGSSPSTPGTTSPNTQTEPEPSSSSTNNDSSGLETGLGNSYVSLREIGGFY